MAKRGRKLNETEIIQKNLEYCREQLERFLKKNYWITFNGELKGNKDLHKSPSYRYASTEFQPNDYCIVRISTEILLSSGEKSRGLQLRALQREGVRIALAKKRVDYSDKSVAFKQELMKHGLYDYDGLPEVGIELHSYICSECKKIWALQLKRLPKSKDPMLPYKNKKTGKYVLKLTGCCEAPFLYNGVKLYSNEELKKVRDLVGKLPKGSDKEREVSNKSSN